jgi:hypothetical protein
MYDLANEKRRSPKFGIRKGSLEGAPPDAGEAPGRIKVTSSERLFESVNDWSCR